MLKRLVFFFGGGKDVRSADSVCENGVLFGSLWFWPFFVGFVVHCDWFSLDIFLGFALVCFFDWFFLGSGVAEVP